MKRRIFLSLFACTFAYAALEPSTITLSVNFTGSPSASDVRTSKWIIAQENNRLAALTPPGVPLPSGTAAEIKSSVLICLKGIVVNYMIDSAARADEDAAVKLSQDELRDIHRAISDRLNSGSTAAQILTLIKP